MSQPRLISPMLDNFLMGDPISDRNGVRCCPAMKRDTDEKYIVKIISLPSSQSRLDALLLTGAYKSTEDALEYFRVTAQGIVEENKILQKLANLDGFISYDACQMVTNDEEPGYDIYLLGSYKTSLEKHLNKSIFTYLDALKLGVDLCSALASCRRAGYLYVDLKPENIYVSENGEYRIGDLGFLRLDSLKFATLSDIYRSEYTAPEIADTFAPLNSTMDVYATGMILYKLFNDGKFPLLQNDTYPAPVYADNELSEIILKAIAIAPEDRWQDPVEMGQALVAYMQSHTITGVTILSKGSIEDSEENCGLYENSTMSRIAKSAAIADEIHDISIESIYTEDENGNLTFIDTSDEKYESANVDTNSTDYRSISADTSGIMSHADDLISHPAPPPVIPPEKVDIPMPKPIVIEQPALESDEEAQDTAEPEEINDTQPAVADQAGTEEFDENENLTPVKIGRLLRNIAIAFIALLFAFGGYFCYRFIYVQEVSIDLDATSDSLTVLVNSKLNDDKLYIVCTDTNGNRFQKNVVDGKAVFTELLPNASYTVTVGTNGFHKLTGKVSETYATPVQINIVQFHAMPGIAEGSVKLSFVTEPSDISNITGWNLHYSAPGEETKKIELSGNSVTVAGLNVGVAYTFRLVPKNAVNYTGITEVTYTPGMLVRAQNLREVSFQGGKLTVAWDAPEGANISKWIVRCYDNQNYDTTIEVTETTATFHGVNVTTTYSVEVTADGMPQSERINVIKEEITIVNLMVNDDVPDLLTLTWNADRAIPTGGWILEYTADGEETKIISDITENTVTILGYIPGATYSFTLKAADESIINGGSVDFETKEIQDLDLFGYKKGSLRFDLCDQETNAAASKFDIGDKAYFSVSRNIYAGSPSGNDDVTIVITIKNADGTVVSLSSKETYWRQIWQTTYYKLPLPDLPDVTGDYVVSVFFNAQLACSKNITLQ